MKDIFHDMVVIYGNDSNVFMWNKNLGDVYIGMLYISVIW